MGVTLYPWNSSGAPKGAQTDTVPGSPQRTLLDALTDPNGKYKISPKIINRGYQIEAGRWNKREAGNDIYRFAEALEFLEQNGWENFQDLRETIGLKDPTDPEKSPEAAKKRIEEIRTQVDNEIGLKPSGPKYCDAFVPKFYQKALPSFEKGGLCLEYPKERLEEDGTNLTAAQGFDDCIGKKGEIGDSGSTLMLIAALKHLNLGCTLNPVEVRYKQNRSHHLFVRHGGRDLDPSGLGVRGSHEYRKLTHRQLIGFHYAREDEVKDRITATLVDPNSSSAHANLGCLLEEEGNYEDARGALDQALILDKNNFHAHFHLGSIFYKIYDLKKSARHYRKALKLDPNDPSARNNLGRTFFYQARYEEAMKQFELAVKLDKTAKEAHANIARALLKLDKFYEALIKIKETIKLFPNYAFAHYLFAKMLYDTNNIPGAIREFKEAIRLDPEYAWAHKRLADVYADKGELKKAKEHYEKAIELDKNLKHVHVALGDVLYKQDDPDGAIREFRAEMKINPKCACAHKRLGDMLLIKGDPAGAIAAYRAALKINPGYTAANHGLSVALLAEAEMIADKKAKSSACEENGSRINCKPAVHPNTESSRPRDEQ